MNRHNRPIQKSELGINRLYRPIQSEDRIGIGKSINRTFRPPLPITAWGCSTAGVQAQGRAPLKPNRWEGWESYHPGRRSEHKFGVRALSGGTPACRLVEWHCATGRPVPIRAKEWRSQAGEGRCNPPRGRLESGLVFKCFGLDGQHTVDHGQGCELNSLHGGVPVEATTVFSEMANRALKAHQMGGSGRHGHKEVHWKVVASACLWQLSTGRQSYPDRVPSTTYREGDPEA